MQIGWQAKGLGSRGGAKKRGHAKQAQPAADGATAPVLVHSNPAPAPPAKRAHRTVQSAAAKALKNMREVVFDGQVYAELWPGGIHSGFSITCECCECSRSLSFLSTTTYREIMSEEECRLRLVRWLRAGLDSAGQSHTHLQRMLRLARALD